MELIYGIKDRPSLDKVFLFALQQLLAIMAATIAVPAIVGNGLSGRNAEEFVCSRLSVRTTGLFHNISVHALRTANP